MPPPIIQENYQTSFNPLNPRLQTCNNPDSQYSSSKTSMIISSLFSSPPITLQFMDLSYTVILPNPATTLSRIATVLNYSTTPQTCSKTIINGISGAAFPGEILAVLGPSGSGKSTLLNALAGRLHPLSGTLLANSRPINRSFLRRHVGYVSQDDVLYTHLTVRETLVFCSLLRLPLTISKSEKINVVDSVIADLSLTKCQHTIIGNGFVRGVSGGERKRVSMAHEMLVNPSVLILDEPTSGLDSTSAHRLLTALRAVSAQRNTTVVAAMHQPSSRLFQMVDKVLLLSEGVSLYYGNAMDAMAYFESIGYSPAWPVNPAEFLLDLANG